MDTNLELVNLCTWQELVREVLEQKRTQHNKVNSMTLMKRTILANTPELLPKNWEAFPLLQVQKQKGTQRISNFGEI